MSTLFRTFVNYPEEAPQGELNTFPSETQPDEVLSIKQILERHVRGLPINSGRTGGEYYDPRLGFVPPIDSLDLTEIHEMRDHFRTIVAAIEESRKKAANPPASLPNGSKPARSEASPQEVREPGDSEA